MKQYEFGAVIVENPDSGGRKVWILKNQNCQKLDTAITDQELNEISKEDLLCRKKKKKGTNNNGLHGRLKMGSTKLS